MLRLLAVCAALYAAAGAADGLVKYRLICDGWWGALCRRSFDSTGHAPQREEYAFGEKADAFKSMASVVARSGSSTMIASVGISTHGEKQNQDMARRFGFIPQDKEELESSDMDKLFPKFMYFKPGDVEGQLYNGKATKAAMLKFLGIEERTCDVLTGAFCSDEQKRHLESLAGKSSEELGKLLKARRG
ncbi:ERP29 [Symbiodinium natans]|uniref:ERP29 protein n=1 Tax=Symbiodinium natans TaxID=878477 RepID=A0A812GQ34_9DINO|nr:ERP29 [Symbiodinium natans]